MDASRASDLAAGLTHARWRLCPSASLSLAGGVRTDPSSHVTARGRLTVAISTPATGELRLALGDLVRDGVRILDDALVDNSRARSRCVSRPVEN
jgi:hypothetical protein